MRFLIIIIALFFYQHSFGQREMRVDSSTISVRQFSQPLLNSYRSDRHFQYDKITEPPISLWDRFWEWFWNKIGDILSTKTGRNTFLGVIGTIAVVILALFIAKLTGMARGGLFDKKNNESDLAFDLLEDDIHSINFETAIETAINDKNFRFAVRLLYLRTLKNLADIGLIQWQVNKTNIKYLEELNDNAHRKTFQDLTLQFENNWYGDLPIGEIEFHSVQDLFNQFNKQVS